MISILYLYPDLLNLYGDVGNITILKHYLKSNNIKFKIDEVSIEDDVDFKKYDLIYIGSGTKDNLNIAYNHIKKYKEDIRKSIDNNKFFLVTGNALDLFTKNYLDIFDLNIINKDTRYVKELFFKSYYTKNNVIGLINRDGLIINDKNPLFGKDGIKYKNFYGTSLIGPVLIKNPEFFTYFIKELTNNKKIKLDLNLSNLAYNEFIKFKENKKNKFKE